MSAKIPVSAIICEFDPLHLGHRLLLDAARASGSLVCCVMSGSFTQRAAPAMLDKWTRARLALENGADLVAELPLSWACAGAERFAAGGVALAAALGAEELWFGSETPDAQRLDRLAEALLSPAFTQALHSQPDAGQSFAVRRQQAAASLLGEEADILAQPNANLAVEYCKAIRRQGASLRPRPIQRQGAGHGQRDEPLPPGQPGYLSASRLRQLVRQGAPLDGLVPPSAARAVEEARALGRCPAHMAHLERAVLCRLRTMSPEDFAALPDMGEGLEHRLYRAARQALSLKELYGMVKSRRVSHARVRRLVLGAFLGLRAPLPELPPYLRLLGLGPRGGQVLRQLPRTLPIVARPKDVSLLGPQAQAVFQAEAGATDLYALACPIPQPAGWDFTQKLVKLAPGERRDEFSWEEMV